MPVWISLHFIGRMPRAVQRFAHIEVHPPIALTGLEHFGRKHFLGRARLLERVAAAEGRCQSIQIQIDAVGIDAAQLRGGIYVGVGRDRECPRIRARI